MSALSGDWTRVQFLLPMCSICFLFLPDSSLNSLHSASQQVSFNSGPGFSAAVGRVLVTSQLGRKHKASPFSQKISPVGVIERPVIWWSWSSSYLGIMLMWTLFSDVRGNIASPLWLILYLVCKMCTTALAGTLSGEASCLQPCLQ